MNKDKFNTLMNEVTDLLRSDRAHQAMDKIDDLLLSVGALPESEEKKRYFLSCQNERANLLFRLNRSNEAEDLLREITQLKQQDSRARKSFWARLLERLS